MLVLIFGEFYVHLVIVWAEPGRSAIGTVHVLGVLGWAAPFREWKFFLFFYCLLRDLMIHTSISLVVKALSKGLLNRSPRIFNQLLSLLVCKCRQWILLWSMARLKRWWTWHLVRVAFCIADERCILLEYRLVFALNRHSHIVTGRGGLLMKIWQFATLLRVNRAIKLVEQLLLGLTIGVSGFILYQVEVRMG